MSSFESGHKLTEELIRQKRSFTALMAFDDMTAFEAIRALHARGVARAGAVLGGWIRRCRGLELCVRRRSRRFASPWKPWEPPPSASSLKASTEYWKSEKSPPSHRKVAPELVVRESTRSLL